MKKKMDAIKENYNISEILPIAPITLKKQKVYLFFSKEQDVNYSLYTDGDVEHLDTWVDKRPYDRDSFFEKCLMEPAIKRYEFYVTNANVLLVEKYYQGNIVRNLYVDQDNLFKVINNQLYQVCISSKEKIMIKRIGEYNGN